MCDSSSAALNGCISPRAGSTTVSSGCRRAIASNIASTTGCSGSSKKRSSSWRTAVRASHSSAHRLDPAGSHCSKERRRSGFAPMVTSCPASHVSSSSLSNRSSASPCDERTRECRCVVGRHRRRCHLQRVGHHEPPVVLQRQDRRVADVGAVDSDRCVALEHPAREERVERAVPVLDDGTGGAHGAERLCRERVAVAESCEPCDRIRHRRRERADVAGVVRHVAAHRTSTRPAPAAADCSCACCSRRRAAASRSSAARFSLVRTSFICARHHDGVGPTHVLGPACEDSHAAALEPESEREEPQRHGASGERVGIVVVHASMGDIAIGETEKRVVPPPSCLVSRRGPSHPRGPRSGTWRRRSRCAFDGRGEVGMRGTAFRHRTDELAVRVQRAVDQRTDRLDERRRPRVSRRCRRCRSSAPDRTSRHPRSRCSGARRRSRPAAGSGGRGCRATRSSACRSRRRRRRSVALATSSMPS